MITGNYNNKTALTFFILLALVFFFSNQNIFYLDEIETYKSADSTENMAIEGSLQRRIAFSLFGLFSILYLVLTGKRNQFQWEGSLRWVLLFFVIWSLASVTWSINVGITIRRLIVFGILCLGAWTMASRISVNFIPLCVFYITALYLCIGFLVEIAFHKFLPFTSDYRFSGTLHPNIQGIHCSMMFITAVLLADSQKRSRYFFLFAAIFALFALILTKSRTSLFSALLSVTVLYFIISQKSRKYTYILLLFIIWIFCILSIIREDILIAIWNKGVLLGREQDSGILTFTGRTELWKAAFKYIRLSPVLGYGYHSFWVPRHIREFSDLVGIPITQAHSVYINQLLNTGIIGFITYVSILIIGMKNAYIMLKNTQEIGYGFLLTFLIYFSIDGLMESEILEFSSLESFLFILGLLYLASHAKRGEINNVIL